MQSPGNRVVTICSISGFISTPGTAAYSTSKFALESFCDTLRREMSPWDLKVAVIEPGAMLTPMISNYIKRRDYKLEHLSKMLSDDIKERWGLEFVRKRMMQDAIVYNLGQDPDVTVEILKHAVQSTNPEFKYHSGWQSAYILYPASLLPIGVLDFIFAVWTKLYSGTPGGVIARRNIKKQTVNYGTVSQQP